MTIRILKFALGLLLLTLVLTATSTPALASASAYEYYSLSSGPSVCAAQITSIVRTWGGGATLYFSDGSIQRDWSWFNANQPVTGGYIAASCSSALSPLSPYADASYNSAESFESNYGLETYEHGGHEPVIIIVD